MIEPLRGRRVRTVLLALVVCLATAAGPVRAGDTLGIGESAPMTDVEMKNVDGAMLSIDDVAGVRGTMVIFSCNSCPWVRAWEDRMVAIGNEYRERDVGVIVINPNDPSVRDEDSFDVMVERAAEEGYEFPYVVDATSDVARAFGATRTPEIFLFDADGRLVYHGVIDDNARDPEAVEKAYLRDALDALLAGEEIAVRQTKALGCTIKFRAE